MVNPFTNQRPAYQVKANQAVYYFVTEYRSLLMIATSVSILACDFPAFSRSLVKTEATGVSLMDLGTGSVLFASALVARHDRDQQTPVLTRLRLAVLSCVPLLFMGSLRFVVHTLLQYPEHESEYGIHWNFYTTLSVVTILASLRKLSPAKHLLLSGVLMCGYQVALSHGLTEYILYAERTNLFAKNREGILGSVGFFSIYSAGLGLKHYILSHKQQLQKLAVATAVSWVMCQAAFTLVEPSRRMVSPR